MAMGPSCSRWMLHNLPGPEKSEFLTALLISSESVVVKGGLDFGLAHAQ